MDVGAIDWHREVGEGGSLVRVDDAAISIDTVNTIIDLRGTDHNLLDTEGDAMLRCSEQDVLDVVVMSAQVGVVHEAVIHNLREVS